MTLAQIAAIISLLLAFGVDQPTVNNVTAILNASAPQRIEVSLPKSTVPIGGTTAPDILKNMTPTIKVYSLQYEDSLGDVYYSGSEELESVTINGNPATISTSKHLDDCIQLWAGTGVPGEKVCGYWMARIVTTKNSGDQIVLTAKNGATEERTLTY